MNAAFDRTVARPLDHVRGGYVLEVVLRVVLLIAVLGQVVYLATNYRERVDVTKGQLYTLTESTRRVIDGLKQRLVIEAYFSRDDKLGAAFRENRRMLDNFLDELVQVSGGKIKVEKLDPQEDVEIKLQAERVGIRPAQLQDVGDNSLNVNVVWQGLRLLYGGERQEVVPMLRFQTVPTGYETELTPRIKALTVETKPKIGLIAFATDQSTPSPFSGASHSQPRGYNDLAELVRGRYELVNVDLTRGQLVPEDMDTLLLVRPKYLTDRQKYALDQFLMRGGKLVVFADTCEVEIGDQRSFLTKKVSNDAPDATIKLRDQLASYGALVDDKVVADFLREARVTEPFNVYRQTVQGPIPLPLDLYPYWFHAVAVDYAAQAEVFAREQSAGNGDSAELAARYRATFKPGVDMTNAMFQAMKQGPGMFWPCPVDIAPELPAGVTANVLLRSSPYSIAENPPNDFNPLGQGRRDAQVAYNQFVRKLLDKLKSEPRQQFGLMVELSGTFPSYFKGREIPPRTPPDNTAATPALPDPLQEGLQSAPSLQPPAATQPESEGKESEEKSGEASGTPPPAEKPAEEPAEEPKEQAPAVKPPHGPSEDLQDPEKPAAAEPAPAAAEPQGTDPANAGEAQEQEPQPPPETTPAGGQQEAQEQAKEEDPEPILQAPPHARLVVIGDADFIRDDTRPVAGRMGIESAMYGPLGPTSVLGPRFFVNLLDWLAEDEDLLALRNKINPEEVLSFVDDDLQGSREDYLAQVKSREKLLSNLNVIGPVAAIVAIWLVATLRRRARKQSFLASVQS
jgi:hypothetical protein